MSELPRRVYGTHLPAEAYRGRHRVGPADAASPGRWSADATTLETVLAGLSGRDAARTPR